MQASSRNTPCDLCGHQSFAIVETVDRHRKPLTTVLCQHCGLISHEHIPSDQELQNYYATQYRRDYHGEYQPSPHRILRAWEAGHRFVKLLTPYVLPGSHVGEIGAGIGCTVKAFELAGFRASGIEPGQGFQRYSREVLRANVLPCSLEDLPAEPSYDFLLLIHVIEHFSSPRQALERISKLLRPQGRLYVECPNAGAPHAAPGKCFHFAHIHNFTPDTLEMLAESCGFKVVSQLSDSRSRVLKYVLAKSEVRPVQIRPESVERTRAALDRYSRLTYHLRWSYWKDRLERDAHFLSNRLLARTRVKAIERQCQSAATRAA